MQNGTLSQRSGMTLVFVAGVLWSTVGLGVRFIENAEAWQILFLRSISFSLFLALVIYLLWRKNPLVLASQMHLNVIIAAFSLLPPYEA